MSPSVNGVEGRPTPISASGTWGLLRYCDSMKSVGAWIQAFRIRLPCLIDPNLAFTRIFVEQGWEKKGE